jgi:hypothetical protein
VADIAEEAEAQAEADTAEAEHPAAEEAVVQEDKTTKLYLKI